MGFDGVYARVSLAFGPYCCRDWHLRCVLGAVLLLCLVVKVCVLCYLIQSYRVRRHVLGLMRALKTALSLGLEAVAQSSRVLQMTRSLRFVILYYVALCPIML